MSKSRIKVKQFNLQIPEWTYSDMILEIQVPTNFYFIGSQTTGKCTKLHGKNEEKRDIYTWYISIYIELRIQK